MVVNSRSVETIEAPRKEYAELLKEGWETPVFLEVIFNL